MATAKPPGVVFCSFKRAVARLCWLGVACLGVVACEGGDIRSANGLAPQLFDDGVVTLNDATTDRSLVQLDPRLVGTSADGRTADLVIAWALTPAAQAAIARNTTLLVAATTHSGEQSVLSRHRVEEGQTQGEIDVTVPVDTDVMEVTVGLDGLTPGIVDDLPSATSLTLPSVIQVEPTPEDQIVSLRAELVPGSYRAEIEGGRRVHRFAVNVEGELADSPGEGPVSITGLDSATSRHFIAFEDGIDDPESPVMASFEEQRVTVYLVMDVSSSVTLAGAADDLLDAVSRTLLALAPYARFDYRVFASDVYEIDSLRDLDFDELTDSGTAFYRAVDTALDDAEAHDGDVVLIAFTDGRDLASRNFYPAFLSHEQVLDHVANRLANVADARRQHSGARFEAHFVSLGSEIDTHALERLAQAGNGAHFPSFSNDTVQDAFSHLTRGVLGQYQLVYSSQQRAGDAALVLQVQANGIQAPPITLPTRAGLAPSD